ncbi:MAG: hypothetical protein U5K75_02455 [Ahrensia sp.]|nr:hypothetical protein [Ahrensia sp.]
MTVLPQNVSHDDGSPAAQPVHFALSLFDWRETQELAALRDRRVTLLKRIHNLPRYSHKRIVAGSEGQ